MNALPESKPKRAPKPAPAPLGTSASGRKRYRVTVAEHDEEVARLMNQLWDFDRLVHRFIADIDTADAKAAKWKRLALALACIATCAGAGVVGVYL